MLKVFSKDHSNMAKGLAILLLLTYHLFENEALITSLQVNYQPFSLSNFLTFTEFGNVCVSVFVFLTSFGIATGLFSQKEITISVAYQQAVKRFFILMIQFFIVYISINLLWWYKFDYQSLYGINKQGFLFMLTDAAGLSMFFDTPTLNETWWYMEIAYILIFLIPFLTWIVKKIGYPFLLIAAFLPYMVTLNPDLERYFFVSAFGVCAAYGKWLDHILQIKIHPVVKGMIGIIGFFLCVLIRQNYMIYEHYIHIIDAPIALFLVYFASAVLGAIPGIKQCFVFIGKHAMNIYLVHTFFYMALWQKYIYYFHYAFITLSLLIIVCLIYSILLELIKKFTGINKLLARYHG